MSIPTALVQKLWNYCNILRNDGLFYGDYPSTSLRTGYKQLTFLLFLKIADEQVKPPVNSRHPSARLKTGLRRGSGADTRIN